MFGTEPDTNNNANAQPATTDSQATPVVSPATSMIGRDSMPADTPTLPAPDTSIQPSKTAIQDKTAPYLDSSSPPPQAVSASNSFLATGSGAPTISSGSSKTPAAVAMPPEGSEDLIKLKQEALQNLAPLIDKLDQPPEERFKTLMMMIQASDNADYLDEAYEAANGIKDEKEKAQALLDVVNEINYFTQNPEAKG